MQSNRLRQVGTREEALAQLHELLEHTTTDILLAYLPVIREYARSPDPIARRGGAAKRNARKTE